MTTFSPYDSKVNSFYLAFYGRPADPDGLKFWSKQLTDNNGDFGAIVDFFAASEEAQVRFGTDTVAERIAEIYQQLFNRAPDTDGMAFWTGAIEQGHASLADVAISILNGAQGTDSSLAQLRQQAVDAFTAEVDASGSQYAGYASIEAARILVRAVTADATADDLSALVKAAVSFADTATKTPQVVEAIAVNTTLLALFDTARGVKEPVALAKALADTAKAAAGDPVTLEQLLRGGGMDKVLKVMPANATLDDVVKALAEGGLPAAVEVVYPTTPTTPSTPTPTYKLSFVSVDQGEGDTKVDHVTRKEIVDVTFSYRGNDLNSSQKYEYRINGSDNWISGSEHITVDTTTNTVILKHIDLSLGEEAMGPKSIGIMGYVQTADLLSNIELRAVRSDGSPIDSVTQQIVYDHFAERPQVSVTLSEFADYFDDAVFTKVPVIDVKGLEPGAKVEYSQLNIYSRIPEPHEKQWTTALPDLTDDGFYAFVVRQTDAAGNVSDESEISFWLDREAPGKPTIALQQDSGVPEDGITNVNKIEITDLATERNTAWEYSVNGGKWTLGGENFSSNGGTATLTLEGVEDGKIDVQVRQIDAAGNIGEATKALSFELDTTAPAGKFSLHGVQGSTNGNVAVTTLDKADVSFDFSGVAEEGDTFEYRLDDGQWQALDASAFANGILTVGEVDFTTKDRSVTVRVVDAAGNITTSKSVPIDSTFNDVPLVTITAAEPSFGLNGPRITLTSSADSLLLADKTKLSLDIMNTGSAGLTPDYFDGTVKMVNNTLTLDSMPELNLYQLSWEKGAFTTTTGGDVEAGSKLLVGGSIATVSLPGFAIDSMKTVSSSGVDHSNDSRINNAFITLAESSPRIHSGDGHDLIADNGSNMTLVYDKLSMTAYDVVLGFDSGSSSAADTDKIELGGPISNRYDLNHDGKLTWGVADSTIGKYQPAPGVEAVELTALNSQTFTALMGGDTLKALNAALNVSNFAVDTGLLILATYQDQSILLSYVEKSGNGKVDQADLAFIALFDQGTVGMDDIELVGSFVPPIHP